MRNYLVFLEQCPRPRKSPHPQDESICPAVRTTGKWRGLRRGRSVGVEERQESGAVQSKPPGSLGSTTPRGTILPRELLQD